MSFYYYFHKTASTRTSRSGFRTLQSVTQHASRFKVKEQSLPNGICSFRTKAKHISSSHTVPRSNRVVALFAKGLKLVRIPVLIISVYGLGYNQGVMDYARNPDKKRRILLEQIVRGYGCEDPSSILIAQEGSVRSNPSEDAYTENSSRLVQLAKISFVGDKIVQSGKSFVDEKIKEIIGKHMKQRQNATGDPVSQDEMEESLSQDVDFMKWTEAKERMENGTTTTATRGEKWKFVLVDSPVPNACVSELVPCTIFVTTSLLNTFTTNDDELALILGHEVSHLIHGHGSEAIDTETFLKTMEVLMLSLDPTEGFLSVFIIGAISILHRFLSASYSQHHELEADEMGIALAARACFDTRIAPLTFQKMHQHHLESNRELYGSADTNRRGISDFLSTHPPSLERYEKLTQASMEENPEKYRQTHCNKIKKGFFDSLGKSKVTNSSSTT